MQLHAECAWTREMYWQDVAWIRTDLDHGGREGGEALNSLPRVQLAEGRGGEGGAKRGPGGQRWGGRAGWGKVAGWQPRAPLAPPHQHVVRPACSELTPRSQPVTTPGRTRYRAPCPAPPGVHWVATTGVAGGVLLWASRETSWDGAREVREREGHARDGVALAWPVAISE